MVTPENYEDDDGMNYMMGFDRQMQHKALARMGDTLYTSVGLQGIADDGPRVRFSGVFAIDLTTLPWYREYKKLEPFE